VGFYIDISWFITHTPRKGDDYCGSTLQVSSWASMQLRRKKKKTAWPTGSAAHGIETMKNAMTYSRCHLFMLKKPMKL